MSPGCFRWLTVLLSLAAAWPARAEGNRIEAGSPGAQGARLAFQRYFRTRFPNVGLDEFADGPYAIDPSMRAQWHDIMQIPPYVFAVDEGKRAFETPLRDGRTYAQCLTGGGLGTGATYPRFDTARGEVVTLPVAINRCRAASGEKPLEVDGDAMAALDAYIVFTSRGRPITVEIPDDARARAAFAAGRSAFDTRRGSARASCASCHVAGAGVRPGRSSIAPALGILAAFPVYRSGWGDVGTAERRIRECDAGIGNAPLPADDPVYRDITYYLSYMSNGITLAGPGAGS